MRANCSVAAKCSARLRERIMAAKRKLQREFEQQSERFRAQIGAANKNIPLANVSRAVGISPPTITKRKTRERI